MNIEEIKERLKNASGEYGWYVTHDTDITYEEPAGSCDEYQVCVINNLNDAQFVGNAKDDIEYLLSIIEQAEKNNDKLNKLLLKASDGFRTESYSKEEIEFIASLRTKSALQAIRRNE